MKVTFRVRTVSVQAAAQVRHIVTAHVRQELPPMVVRVPAARGPMGPPGPKGDPGGLAENFPLAVLNPQAGDILKFTGSAWANDPAADLVDGGNF